MAIVNSAPNYYITSLNVCMCVCIPDSVCDGEGMCHVTHMVVREKHDVHMGMKTRLSRGLSGSTFTGLVIFLGLSSIISYPISK